MKKLYKIIRCDYAPGWNIVSKDYTQMSKSFNDIDLKNRLEGLSVKNFNITCMALLYCEYQFEFVISDFKSKILAIA